MLEKKTPHPILIEQSEERLPVSIPSTPSSTETREKRYQRIQIAIKARTAELIAIRDKALTDAPKKLSLLNLKVLGFFSGLNLEPKEETTTPPLKKTKITPIEETQTKKVPVPPSFTKKMK